MSIAIKKQDIEDLIEVGELVSEHEATALIKQEKIKNGIQKSTEYTALLSNDIRKNARIIDDWLADITVCDPAVGSGAFPVGMMNEIVRARNVLSVFLNDRKRNDYEFKRRCIEHSLYGVDIDPGAVEIAKLRLWLSLVVDEEDIKNIKPLPNLDYKIVCGNSLLGVEKDLFNNQLLNDLEKLKLLFFKETNPTQKQAYKRQIDELIGQITKGHREFDFEVYFSEVFHEKGGFDVVIGNPPYIQLQKDGGTLARMFKNCGYTTYERAGDIYALFYEKGINIIRNNGVLCFITSNKWMRSGYGKSLRTFFLKHNPRLLIDLGPGIFESVIVDTNILIMEKAGSQPTPLRLDAVTLTSVAKDRGIALYIQSNKARLTALSSKAWYIGSHAEQKLKGKIERIGKPLKDWDVNIYRGILTGLNKAFIITTEKRNEILANCRDEEERHRTETIIKPILRGRDIKRYYYEWAGLWVIGTFPALRLSIDNFPALKKYFLDHFNIRQLEQSGKKHHELGFDARKKTGNKWFETQDQISYYPEFEKEKVVWIELVDDGRFSFTEIGMYTEATTFLMTHAKSRYLVGCLNSFVINWYFDTICASSGTGTNRWKKIYVELLPIPQINLANQPIAAQIEGLVDRILAKKKEDLQADTKELERVIDQMVYKLYGLTENEIKIVEGGIN
ncbi:MAG: TaqI-like C-terminal specificity domain-containing protein [Desulfobacterales bacterium]